MSVVPPTITTKRIDRSFLRALLIVYVSLCSVTSVFAQALDVTSCPMIEKRSNGNGQASRSPGNFPGYGQNNPVAANVVGTSYQNVAFDPAGKTGNINFKWSSATTLTNLPVITRTWVTASGSSSGTLSAVKFGPPPPPEVVGQNYYVSYSFYVQNLPPAGKITLEFADPKTNKPAFRCTFDLQSNGTATEPVISCAPTITTQPVSQSVCGASTASFTVAADGAASIQWQVNNSGTWTNISNGGDYSGATSNTLTISNPASYDGKSYRAVALGDGACGNTNSDAALLIAKPKPTAVFSGAAALCGTGTRSMGVTLTGTGPWSITYTTTPSGGSTTTTTVNNIAASPFYFSVSPSGTTTYAITSVSDAYCSNASPSGNVSSTVYATPTVTPSNAISCSGSGSFQLSYTATGNPDKYTLSAGVRAVAGFTTITNGSLSASPLTISIPSNTPAGVYDFNLVVSNSVSGCGSTSIPFTVTVKALPAMGATAGDGTVCAGGTATLTASPAGLASYSWSLSGVVVASGITPTVTVGTNSSYTYVVTGVDATGCAATASVTLTTVSGPSLVITSASATICNGNSTTLTASGGNTYSWSPATGLSATTGTSVVASPSSTTTYTVTSKNATGCQSVGTVTVTVTTPAISVTPSATICAGASKTLTATGGTSYSWYPATGLSATTGSSVVATPSATTTYYVVGTDASGCSATASTTVTIAAAPVDAANSVGSTYSFCSSSTTSFTLPIVLTGTVSSATWQYASAQAGPYTNLSTGATTVGSGGSAVTFTVAASGLSNTLAVSNYSNGGYGGPRYLRLAIVDASCTYNYDILLYDIKGSGTAPTPTAAKTTVCSGEPAVLSIGGLNSNVTIQWQSASTLNGTYSNIVGATNSTYTTGNLNSGTNNFFKAVLSTSGGGGCSYTTGALQISIASAAASNTLTPTTSCTDGISNLTINGSSTSGTYQWQKSTDNSSFSNVLGAVSQNYTLPNTTVPVTTYYKRISTEGSCSATTSNTVEVYAPLASNQISNDVTAYCTTATATVLNGTTPSGGNGIYTYQWQSSTNGTNFSDIIGANAINYTTSSQTQTYWYRRIVTSGGCSSTSSSFKITVNSTPSVSVTSGSSQCAGTAVSLTASGAVSYSWSPATELSATTGAVVIATATATRTYTVTGTDGNGCTGTATTTITVTANPSAPTLSTATKTICSGTSTDLTALVTSGGTTEWYTAPEVNAAYLVSSPTAVSTARTYYVFAKSGSCYSTGYATLTLSVTDITAPVVAATSLSYCAPATADLMALQPVAASGVSLEWHTASSGPSAGNLVATPTAVGSGTYYLYAYSTAGNCYGTASSAVTVTINTPTNASVSATTAAVCAPGTVDLTAYNNTAGTNTYSWYSTNNPLAANLVAIPAAVSQVLIISMPPMQAVARVVLRRASQLLSTVNPLQLSVPRPLSVEALPEPLRQQVTLPVPHTSGRCLPTVAAHGLISAMRECIAGSLQRLCLSPIPRDWEEIITGIR